MLDITALRPSSYLWFFLWLRSRLDIVSCVRVPSVALHLHRLAQFAWLSDGSDLIWLALHCCSFLIYKYNDTI